MKKKVSNMMRSTSKKRNMMKKIVSIMMRSTSKKSNMMKKKVSTILRSTSKKRNMMMKIAKYVMRITSKKGNMMKKIARNMMKIMTRMLTRKKRMFIANRNNRRATKTISQTLVRRSGISYNPKKSQVRRFWIRKSPTTYGVATMPSISSPIKSLNTRGLGATIVTSFALTCLLN